MAQKVNKYFGNFCEGMRLQNLSKIAQSGHTGQQQQRRRLHRVQGRRRSFQNLFSNVKRQVSLSLSLSFLFPIPDCEENEVMKRMLKLLLIKL